MAVFRCRTVVGMTIELAKCGWVVQDCNSNMKPKECIQRSWVVICRMTGEVHCRRKYLVKSTYSPSPPAFSRQVLHALRISSFCNSYSFLILWIISALPEDRAKQQERQTRLFINGHWTVFFTSLSQIAHSSAMNFPF